MSLVLEHVVGCLAVVSYVRYHPSAWCVWKEETCAFHASRLCKCQLNFSAGPKSQGRQSHLGLAVGLSYATSSILPELLGSGGRDRQDLSCPGQTDNTGRPNRPLEGPVPLLCALLEPEEQRSSVCPWWLQRFVAPLSRSPGTCRNGL